MSESISFRRMHNTIGMFWRRIECKQFQSFIASVGEIMFRSDRHSKHITRSDIMRFPSHDGLSRTFDKNQDLVNHFVDFPANVFTRKNAHQDYLGMSVREQDLSKVIVFQSQLLDILVLHNTRSPFFQGFCLSLDSSFELRRIELGPDCEHEGVRQPPRKTQRAITAL